MKLPYANTTDEKSKPHIRFKVSTHFKVYGTDKFVYEKT